MIVLSILMLIFLTVGAISSIGSKGCCCRCRCCSRCRSRSPWCWFPSLSFQDNDFIYHDRIPEASSLPTIKGASLVKPIPFDPSDAEISGPDIFAQLVPMKVHEAASIYSEEIAKLLRQIGGEIEEKNSELDEFLTNLDLDAVRSVEEREKVREFRRRKKKPLADIAPESSVKMGVLWFWI